ncbi:hypothetical protein MELA_01255 [Candidatus Methylomirabilis lanthanidiphila]|uniref:Uncharacterized protein n=1 Tax=Candidatus Methylomirabilis lanthanidiphila TaxID=2211376 RepID=A0A564ZHR3_9BACT|nr:hypothetical protein [Candidatus Methylomirabilis lanthanidiphila]VUZ84880.1 hypothetical protein MELA_01255 [Candidatus Methylomirabilis lanthanidiphila]
MVTRFLSVALAIVLAGFAIRASASDFVPRTSRERIFSTNGFSFLPPQGSTWLEKFGKSEITYLKKTDSRMVSFYVGALEGRLRSTLESKEALVAFVRSKKEQWGEPGRYSDTSSSFAIEDENDSCVRYRLSASDRNAPNKGSHEFLVMRVIGRFCQHPQDKSAAVDVFYSARYVPAFDAKELFAEGEQFLQSLQFSKTP